MVRLAKIVLLHAVHLQNELLKFAAKELLDLGLGTVLDTDEKVRLDGNRRLEMAAVLLEKVKVNGRASSWPFGIPQKSL